MMKTLLLSCLLFYNPLNADFAQTLTAGEIYSKINVAVVAIYTFDSNGKILSQGTAY